MSSQRSTLLSREEAPAGPRQSVGREMLLERGEERRWKRNGPTPGLALRWTQDQSTVSKLLLLLLNNQFAVKDVHVPAFKPEQFSKSQSAKAGEEHEAAVWRRRGVCGSPYLRNCRGWAFLRTFHASPIDTAGIAY